MDDKKLATQKIYAQLCEELDSRNWKYGKFPEDLAVQFGVASDDMGIDLLIFLDNDRQLIRLISPMPFKMGEDKRVEGCIAACHASNGLVDGCFDYDISDGTILFRQVYSFIGTDDAREVISYMINLSCAIVDRYNDKFFALNKGFLSLEDFLKAE